MKKDLKTAINNGMGNGLKGLMGDDTEKVEELAKEADRPTQKKEKQTKTLQAEDRITLIMPRDLYQKIKVMAHWELTTMKEIINNSLEKTVKDYEKTHGELNQVPKSKKTRNV